MKDLIYSIEDDKDIAKIINLSLSKQGYEVKTFYDGTSFFNAFNLQKPDLILLDMMLPDISGQAILTKIRSDKINDDIPIIIISANSLVTDKVIGLDMGADDYISKPFDLLEMMSRVNARLRKNKRKVIECQDLVIDIDSHICTYKNNIISLTTKEFEILILLLKNKGKVCTREDILQAIWGNEALETRTIDMHVKSIRKKTSEDVIETIFGIGYKIS